MGLRDVRVSEWGLYDHLLPVPANAGGKGAEHGGGQGLVHCATHFRSTAWQALPRGHWLLLEQVLVWSSVAHRKFPLPSTEPSVPLQDDPQVPNELLIWKQPPWSES